MSLYFDDESNERPVNVKLSQLRRALELAERAQLRAQDESEATVTFSEVDGMRLFDGAVMIESRIYRGGGSDSFELLVDANGDTLLEWSSDDDPN